MLTYRSLRPDLPEVKRPNYRAEQQKEPRTGEKRPASSDGSEQEARPAKRTKEQIPPVIHPNGRGKKALLEFHRRPRDSFSKQRQTDAANGMLRGIHRRAFRSWMHGSATREWENRYARPHRSPPDRGTEPRGREQPRDDCVLVDEARSTPRPTLEDKNHLPRTAISGQSTRESAAVPDKEEAEEDDFLAAEIMAELLRQDV